MTQSELDHLIKMANQIAAHCAPGASEAVAAEKAANHIQMFWAASMKRQLIAYFQADGEALSETAQAAVLQLNA